MNHVAATESASAHVARAATQSIDVAGEPPRLAFVHVPKTAGTSVTNALERAYGGAVLPAMTTLDYRCYSDEQLAGYRLYKGHAYRRDYRRLPEDTIRFTVLRDPVRRAVSYFNYYRSIDVSHVTDEFVLEASELAKSESVIEFIHSDSPFIIEHLRLGQVRQFLSDETLAEVGHRQCLTRKLRKRVVEEFIQEMTSFQYAITCESLAMSFPLMCRQLLSPGKVAIVGHDNASPASATVDFADVRRALVEVSGAEFCCYEHVRDREQAWLAHNLAGGLAVGPRAGLGAGGRQKPLSTAGTRKIRSDALVAQDPGVE